MDARKYFDFGIGTYVQNLLLQYDRLLRHPLTVFVSPEDRGSIAARHRASVRVNTAGKYSLRELFSLSRQASRLGVELFHAPHYTLPIGLRAGRVVTIHDLIHLRFPEYFNGAQRAYASWAIRHACVGADAVIVDAQCTKEELLERFSIDAAKIHVVPLGVAEHFRSEPGPDEAEVFRRRHGIPDPFALYVGGLKPHKNVRTLLKAMSQLSLARDLRLVLVGEKIEEYPELRELVGQLGLGKRISCLGRLPDQELAAAYRTASLVLLPSLYEGFGLPLLEAMASGTPVIGARVASIPEVIGDAGIYVDPSRSEDIARSIDTIMHDGSLRESLKKKGIDQSKRFSWERCAQATIRIYEEVHLQKHARA